MKVRHGFVSNSSTSSFLCGVCGNIEAERDMRISEAGMIQCKNDHIFCEGHSEKKFDDLSNDEKRQMLLNDPDYADRLIGENFDELYEEWYGEVVYECPVAMCPLCQLKEVPNDLLLSYLLRAVGSTKQQIVQQIKDKYGTCDKLTEDLKEL